MPLQGRLSIEHLCQLVAVSRRGFYRSLRQREPAEEETEVRSLIQQIALEHRRRYGYRVRRLLISVRSTAHPTRPATARSSAATEGALNANWKSRNILSSAMTSPF
jgi:hypothetical protein